jgi:hypothetical protein
MAGEVHHADERPGPSYRPIAIATERIDRDRAEVCVHHGGRVVELPRFTELVVVTPLRPETRLTRLVNKTLLLVPSKKREGEWDVFTYNHEEARLFPTPGLRPVFFGVQRRGPLQDELALPDNVFRVKQVLLATSENPVEVSVGSDRYRLKRGEALLVLG